MEKELLSELDIKKIIVHDVPKHKKNDYSKRADYSERESLLTEELKLFFRDKIVESINNKGFKVTFDHSPISPIPGTIKLLLNTPTKDFILRSKKVAKHLYDIQTGINPGGIIVLISGEINNDYVVALLKLERDEGAQLKKNSRERRINIVQVKDLMLTQKTKLYKVGLFFLRDNFQCDFDGFVSDNQLALDSAYGVAKFFLTEYLGCQLYGDTKKMTKDFFNISKEFIQRIDDPIQRATYYNHLISYSKRPNKLIDYREFANYFEEEDRQSYVDFLEQNKFDFQTFQKDTELIKSHINKILIDFDNDISIMAKNGDLDRKVKLSYATDGLTRAEIIGKIKNIH